MVKWLLAVYALQAVGAVAGFGSAIQQIELVLGTSPIARGLTYGLVFGQVLVTGYEVYDQWHKEREARERLTR